MMRIVIGKTALVTGAASGIGRASALAFAREGANVVVSDINEKGGEDTVRLIKQTGGNSVFIRADVSNSNEVETLINRVIEIYGRLDFAHNNAGILGELVGTLQYTENAWDTVISVNLKGVWLCMKYEIPQMLKLNKGSIVNTSSIAGLVGNNSNPAYHASKHGVIGLTKVAALEFAKSGIRVNAICPGIINTPMIKPNSEKESIIQSELITSNPIGRFGRPEEVANAAVWLCSDSASFITGQFLAVDGGLIAQ